MATIYFAVRTFGAAIIRGQCLFEGSVHFTQSFQMVRLLFEGGVYSKRYGILIHCTYAYILMGGK